MKRGVREGRGGAGANERIEMVSLIAGADWAADCLLGSRAGHGAIKIWNTDISMDSVIYFLTLFASCAFS